MFNVIRRILLRRPCCLQVFTQNCSFQLEARFIDHNRFIFASPSISNTYLYHLIKRTWASKDYPEHVLVKLPALSPTMEAGGLASWVKKEGDSISEGDVIAEVETDKATMAVEADDPGFIAKILIPAGTANVRVGTPICIVVEKEEHISAFKDYDKRGGGALAHASPPHKGDGRPAAHLESSKSPPTESPKQKSKTRKPAIDFKKVDATKGDHQPSTSVAKSAPPSGKYTDHPVNNIRQVIAKRLVQSKQEIPHFYLTLEVETGQMEAIRKVLNAELAKSGVKISVNDIVIKATALACKDVPEANSTWMGNIIRQYHSVDVSIAVSTPTGLITPIVFDADAKQIRDISNEVKELAKKARQGKLTPKDYQGGTVTVSNLGMFGINDFCAIINPPQSCILAVGTSGERIILKEGGINSIGVKKYINVTLSCDHRVVDGAVGAQWLQAFKNYMENPKTMF